MIKRAVSLDGTVVFDAEAKDGTSKCVKCRAPQPQGKEFHYVTCPLWKEWQKWRVSKRRPSSTKEPNDTTT